MLAWGARGEEMIVVRVELWSARTGKKTVLGQMNIAHVRSNEKGTVADYHGEVMRKPDFQTATREAEVAGHRRHDLVVWVLVRRMLERMGY